MHTIEIDLNDLVEIILVDEAGFHESHPMHLHGYSFAVLGTEKVITISKT
jgi:FtsP/CotA-like multicopper oxidase with cupredoxin domain